MDPSPHPDVYGVIWFDLLLGELCLSKPTRAEAEALARSILDRGAGKVKDVRLAHVPADSDSAIFIPLGEWIGPGQLAL